MSFEYRNLPVHNLTPVGPHIEVAFDDAKAYRITKFTTLAGNKNSWFLSFQLKNGDATMTVDGETDPIASGKGRPVIRGVPFTLSRFELRQLRIIAETAQTPTLVGQLYYYTEQT